MGRASGTIPILVTRWTASWPPWSGRPGPRREGCARRSTSGAVRGCGSDGRVPRSGRPWGGRPRWSACPARPQLDRALQLNPQYVEALIHKAIVLNELGREYEADASLRRAGKLWSETRQGLPAHVAAKLANQHAALGDAYLEAGALPHAIEQYQTALALGPTFHDLRYKLGRILLQGGQALEAREQFEIIVRNRPTYLDAAAMLGLACYLAGDGLAAKAVWEDCRERRPEDPRVEAYLAMLARNDTGPPAATAAPAEAAPEPEGHRGRGGKKKKP